MLNSKIKTLQQTFISTANVLPVKAWQGSDCAVVQERGTVQRSGISTANKHCVSNVFGSRWPTTECKWCESIRNTVQLVLFTPEQKYISFFTSSPSRLQYTPGRIESVQHFTESINSSDNITSFYIKTELQCVSKNDTDLTHNNSEIHQTIMIILCMNVAEKVNYQTMIYFSTSLTNVTALPGDTGTPEIVFT